MKGVVFRNFSAILDGVNLQKIRRSILKKEGLEKRKKGRRKGEGGGKKRGKGQEEGGEEGQEGKKVCRKRPRNFRKNFFLTPLLKNPKRGNQEEGGKKRKERKVGTYSNIYSTPTQ